MNNFLSENYETYKVNPDVFLDAISNIFNIDEVDRLKLYWLDISEYTDESIVNSELQLKQVSYVHHNGKVEELLYNYDESCFEIHPDTPNRKFIDAVAKHLLGENTLDEVSKYLLGENSQNKFENIYIQYSCQLEEYANNKEDYLICGKKIKGQIILTKFCER
ncbi:hypothetical protein NBRC116592_16970 [Colwellia sp. KU-HH00111]|uniref:hypothetical protein n=1 Tax=Colwellia sp. KU-HH00111 TaxID=3127652 RepID=UPI003105103F